MPSWKKKHSSFFPFVSCLVVLFALIGLVQWTGWLPRIEWPVLDGLNRLASQRTPVVSDFIFITLDQRSLEQGETEFELAWPWPRDAYAHVLSFLKFAQAKTVFLDFIFSEASYKGPEDDQTLADAIKKADNVVLPVFAKAQGKMELARDFLLERPEVLVQLDTPGTWRGPAAQGLLLPVERIRSAVKQFGDARFTADADGVIRRISPLAKIQDGFIAQFGLAPLNTPGTRVMLSDHKINWGTHIWPLDDQGNLVLKFPGYRQAFPQVSMIDVIVSNVAIQEGTAPKLDPAMFRDKVVFIGSTAEGLMDLRKTPLESETPGFYVNAAVYAAALHDQFYNMQWQTPLFWPSVLLLGLLGIGWGRFSFWRGLAGLLSTAVIFQASIVWLFLEHSIQLYSLTPNLTLLVTFGFSMGISYWQEQRKKTAIQNAFSQVLSKAVLEKLMQHPERLSMTSETAEITVYFSDLAGFTSLSEQFSPQDLLQILNTYLGDMVETIVDEQDGYVDKFIGDAVMAFWNAPIPIANHALRACHAALRNQEKLAAMQARLRSKGLKEVLGMRIGIHTGPAVVGMMGSPKKLNYTVIGDTVNLASRLEGVNKQFGTQILASWDTMQQVGDQVVTRELDRIRVKGKLAPTRIFEVVGLPGTLPLSVQACLDAYQKGTQLFWERKFKSALKCFKAALQAKPDDYPSELFIERCQVYSRKAPEKGWDGVTSLKTK